MEPEEGVVKKVHSSADGRTVFHVRLVSDGYMVPSVPAEELAVLAAGGQVAASRHPSDELRFEADAEYDATVRPQLPEPPADPKGEGKYEWAAAFKEVGNALFQQGQHAWALRTYLTGVQQLQLHGYGADNPEQIFSDARAWPVCTARYVAILVRARVRVRVRVRVRLRVPHVAMPHIAMPCCIYGWLHEPHPKPEQLLERGAVRAQAAPARAGRAVLRPR